MENAAMGKVVVTAKIESAYDLYDVHRGMITDDQVRRLEVTDALVDTGATTLCLPKRMVSQLGLTPGRMRRARTTAGAASLQAFGVVKLIVQDREWVGDVLAIPDDCPVLIGQIPLEGLDFVVDPAGQRLIGNPDHGGEQMVDLF